MASQIEIIELAEPLLEFGGVGEYSDPKIGLKDSGPYDLRFGTARLTTIDIGFVGPIEMMNHGINWFKRCKGPIASTMPNQKQYPHYVGFESLFKSTLNFNSKWNHVIDSDTYDKVINGNDYIKMFSEMLDLYSDGIERLSMIEMRKPNVIVCCFPDSLVDKCWSIVNDKINYQEKKWFKKMKAAGQLFFDFNSSFENVEEKEDDLLRRDFRRALKARAMKYGIPIQIGTSRLFVDLPSNQEASIRAWNSTVALYYKAGGIPWRLKKDGLETCYVGISFHHIYTTSDSHIVKSCIAQAFSSDGEGFAIRGVDIPWTDDQDKRVNLTKEQSFELGEKILREYIYRTGATPLRIVVHKSTEFNEDEKEGLYASLHNVPIIELIYLAPTDFRLVRFGDYPPKKGTLCTINKDAHYLFTTGYMPELDTYPGPHIPVPIRIKAESSNNNLDIIRTCEDVLALSRMNWNTASITSGTPVTLFFSRKVGGIMSEYGNNEPPSSFRFYI